MGVPHREVPRPSLEPGGVGKTSQARTEGKRCDQYDRRDNGSGDGGAYRDRGSPVPGIERHLHAGDGWRRQACARQPIGRARASRAARAIDDATADERRQKRSAEHQHDASGDAEEQHQEVSMEPHFDVRAPRKPKRSKR